MKPPVFPFAPMRLIQMGAALPSGMPSLACRVLLGALAVTAALSALPAQAADAGMKAGIEAGELDARIGAHLADMATRPETDPFSTAIPARTAGEEKAAEENAADEDWPEPRPACINARLLRDYTVIDRHHAIFYESVRRPYLVTFFRSCFNLRFSFKILTRTRTGRLCGTAGDAVFVGRERCFIRSIERVASPAQARALVTERTANRVSQAEGTEPQDAPDQDFVTQSDNRADDTPSL